MLPANADGLIITTLPRPSLPSKLVVAAAEPVDVLFPESEFPLSVFDAEDPEVVFVPDCDLVLVADVVFPV